MADSTFQSGTASLGDQHQHQRQDSSGHESTPRSNATEREPPPRTTSAKTPGPRGSKAQLANEPPLPSFSDPWNPQSASHSGSSVAPPPPPQLQTLDFPLLDEASPVSPPLPKMSKLSSRPSRLDLQQLDQQRRPSTSNTSNTRLEPTPGSNSTARNSVRSPGAFVVQYHPHNPWPGLSSPVRLTFFIKSLCSSLKLTLHNYCSRQLSTTDSSDHPSSQLPTPTNSPPRQLDGEPAMDAPSSSGNLLGLFGVEQGHGLGRKPTRIEGGGSVGPSTPPDTPMRMAMESIPNY